MTRIARASLTAFAIAGTAMGAALGGAPPAAAQTPPVSRVIQPIADPSMVIQDRGAALEVLPTQRAVPLTVPGSGPSSHQVFAANATATFGPRQLGVVFNHALQQRGYISGEIIFKLRGSATAGADLSPAQFPGLRRLLAPNIYMVSARTPAQYVQLVRRLQQRTDVQWVDPGVSYGHHAGPPAR